MIGVVLAGGAGTRLGGDKPLRQLRGRPLISYPLAALACVCERVAVVAKPDTKLGALGEAERWDEPPEPRHPLTGIVYALERARLPVLICAADMPFVTPAACRALIDAHRPEHGATVAAHDRLEPLLAVYAPSALPALRAAPSSEPLRRTIASLRPALVELDTAAVASVNTPADLAAAERALTAEAPARPGPRSPVPPSGR